MPETFFPWLMFILYMVAITGLTIWNKSKASSMQSFAVGSRKIPPFFVGLSLAANMTSVATFVINPGLVHAYGWAGIVGYGLAAPLGALMTSRIDVRRFTLILAVVIVLASLRMIFSKKGGTSNGGPVSAARRIIGGSMIGIMVGVMAGLLGIGGGVFIVPLLIYLLKLPTKTAAATSMFIVVFSSFSGFIAHAGLSNLDWRFIGIAALFSFAGGQAGSRLMTEKLKGRTVRIIFGLVLLAFSAKLIHKALM